MQWIAQNVILKQFDKQKYNFLKTPQFCIYFCPPNDRFFCISLSMPVQIVYKCYYNTHNP